MQVHVVPVSLHSLEGILPPIQKPIHRRPQMEFSLVFFEACLTQIVYLFVVVSQTGFEERALALHNKYRTVHNADPLRLSEDLNLAAERYAEVLFNLGNGATLLHSDRESRPDQGENLAKTCTSGEATGKFFESVIKAW